MGLHEYGALWSGFSSRPSPSRGASTLRETSRRIPTEVDAGLVDTQGFAFEESSMSKTRRCYAPEFRRQMVELVQAGRSTEELAREFEPTTQSIRNWVTQAKRDGGRGDGGLTTTERQELRLRRENPSFGWSGKPSQRRRPGSLGRRTRCRCGSTKGPNSRIVANRRTRCRHIDYPKPKTRTCLRNRGRPSPINCPLGDTNVKLVAYCSRIARVVLCLFPGAVVASTTAQRPLSVWFMPAGNSPDIGDLFTSPNEWARARALVDAFMFSPGQLTASREGHPSLLSDLTKVGAFRQLNNWRIPTAIEAPALKEWDCQARQTAAVTIGLMKTVSAAGGSVQFVDMDEPLVSALGLNRPICHLDIDAAAAEVAAYSRAVISASEAVATRSAPRFVDTEAYPSLSVQQIETWIIALKKHGFKMDAFHLDANVHYININPNARTRLARDLQELQKFLRQQGILFGIIIWSGYDPVTSDEEYYNYAMSWARTVHSAIQRPDRVIFESWVKRCPQSGQCAGPNLKCSSSDPSYCGTISVPLNIPEDDPGVFSHTRLILDATALLTG
jgi:transposase